MNRKILWTEIIVEQIFKSEKIGIWTKIIFEWFKKWTKKVGEQNLFWNDFKNLTKKSCERKLWLNEFLKLNKIGIWKEIIFEWFNKWTKRSVNEIYFRTILKKLIEKVCEWKLFLNDFKTEQKRSMNEI